MSPAQAYTLAEEALRQGRFPDAIQLCHAILAAIPEQPDTFHLLGIASYQTGRMEEALQCFRRALAGNPQLTGTRNNLACVLVELGRYGEAVTEFTAALAAQPADAEMHANLGNALHLSGRNEEAAAACETAISLQPQLAMAHNNLGNALRALGQSEAALRCYQTALACDPQYADAHNNVGAMLSDRFENEAAIESFQRALSFQPNSASPHNNLACALSHLGRGREAIPHHQRAIELSPRDPWLHSNLIFNLQFIPGVQTEQIVAEQAAWNAKFARPLAEAIVPHQQSADPERPLRIGFVSPDFREHPIAFFLAGLFEAHDRTRMEVHCYSSVVRADAVTARLRGSVSAWRDVRTLSDDALAAVIREDGIDVLIDLSMHSAENRLTLFARKPAPVQVSWLAYPGTTGVETIDARFTDAVLEPEDGAVTTGPERPVRLPGCWCSYEMIGPCPEVGDLPALSAGHVTFASFSKIARLSDDALRTWGELARRLPSARWLLLHPPGAGRQRVLSFFGENADRVEFVTHRSWVEYLRLFARADICLDTFPCNGLTATCHALWMGTPVLTFAGRQPHERASASILTAAGLPELIASASDAYVRLAEQWAADLPRLASLRRSMRERLRASRLMDHSGFANAFENACRNLWREWCARERSKSVP